MNRENILNGKWFIKFKRFETTAGVERVRDYAGKVIEEVADGWFYIEVFGTGWNVVERKVVSVAEFASCRFYRSEIEFRNDYCGKGIKRTGENNEG